MNEKPTFDVIVVGSGAAGLAAAIAAAKRGASVTVLEKAPQFGGTSAWSGGEAWVPCNRLMDAAGMPDSREAAIAYISSLSNGRQASPELIERFVDTGGEAIEFLSEHSAYQPEIVMANSDYYEGKPGYTTAGRCIAPQVIDSKKLLGDRWATVRDSPHLPALSSEEFAEEWTRRNLPFHARTRENNETAVPDARELSKERLATGIRFMGASMVSGLMRGALDAGVELHTNARVDRLLVEGGAVVGVIVEQDGELRSVHARRGVILASGGFEWNKELTLTYLGVPDVFPISTNTNVGEGLLMGLEVGAAVANMTNPAAIPAIWDEERVVDGQPLGTPSATRTDAGVIIVNQQGRRFANEGICYMDAAKKFKVYDEYTVSYPNETPVWQVFDHTTREKLWDMEPGPTPAWVKEGSTIAELAEKIGVDVDGLVDEVATWNRYVDNKHDPEFHRGEIWWEGFMMGGPSPEKNMARIENGPFYAMRLYNGVVSTLGGLKTDTDARVVSSRGHVIDGLYAVGTVAAGIFGDAYPGAGGTLGPNLVFGYIAGTHAVHNRIKDPHAAVS
ncbi:FAD-dependent oxidoreductase [Mycolicibacterium litorale]|uniref:FAD-dependent oxidoreductase n=1 Tax=Mycolicibacterium litorale TaxID=758802 RepID=UPI003CF48292